MACCGNDYGAESLEGQKFEDIVFKIGEESIKFKVEEGIGGIYQRDLSDKKDEEKKEEKKLNNAKQAIEEEIRKKDERINELNQKIKEIEAKISSMEQILSIDVSEKEYVIALGDQMKNNEPSG